MNNPGSTTADEVPKDRFKMFALIFLLQGVATMMAWSMFINAHSYFTEFKLGFNYTHKHLRYNEYFVQYLTFASQLPTITFSYVNCFVRIIGTGTLRVVGSMIMMIVIFHFNTVLAFMDTSDCPTLFFWATMISVVIMKTFNAIYTNCIFGIVSMLPPKYMKLIFIGATSCGTFASIVAIITIMTSGDLQIAAIYYFLTAIIVLYAALDTYFTLPLFKYYRYYKQLSDENVAHHPKIDYRHVIKTTLVQLYNLCFNFIVTYSCFPAIAASVQPSDEQFFIPKQYYALFMAFLTFNVFNWIGTILAALFIFPKPKFTWIIMTLRMLFIPFFLLSNYRPGGKRSLAVIFKNDYVFFVVSVIHAFTCGYYCSITMQTIPRMVEPEYARNAGMIGGVAITTGAFLGIMVSFIWPSLVI